jgi:phosphatidate cytidylyltransferase
MVLGSVVRLSGLSKLTPEKARSRRESLATWWILFLLLAASVVLGPLGICMLLAAASWIALQEFFALTVPDVAGDHHADRWGRRLVEALVPLTYGVIYLGLGRDILMWLPLVALLLITGSRIATGVTGHYVRSTGSLLMGAILLIFGPAHAALLLRHAEATPLQANGAGWFIFLILLTEMNDIAQALVGRRFGRHKATPVSPNKTWEGFAGGAVVTCTLALLLAPFLTSLATRSRFADTPFADLEPYLWALASGLVITLAGALGDLNMSAFKRDVGVKDSSDLLPGMGGALDRIDSLTLTAPGFYWLIVTTA